MIEITMIHLHDQSESDACEKVPPPPPPPLRSTIESRTRNSTIHIGILASKMVVDYLVLTRISMCDGCRKSPCR